MIKHTQFVSMAILAAGGVSAGTIDFISTGAGLTAGATDIRYTLTLQPGPASYGPAMVVAPDGGFPFPHWIANDAASQWIVPQGASLADMDDNNYMVRTQFTIPAPEVGYELSGVLLRFRVAADNQVSDILLNGVSLGVAHPAAPNDPEFGYRSWSDTIDLSTDEGFAYQPNQVVTLDFNVWNKPQDGGNPMGFRLEVLAAETGISPVPEPATYALVAGMGLVGFAGYRRFRK